MVTVENKAPRHWRITKAKLLDGTFVEDVFSKSSGDQRGGQKNKKRKKNENDKRANKFRHAVSYIKYISSLFSDTCPTNSQIHALPYETRRQLYDEYRHFCKTTLKLNYNAYAGKECFRQAFESVKDSIKLVGCKGFL